MDINKLKTDKQRRHASACALKRRGQVLWAGNSQL